MLGGASEPNRMRALTDASPVRDIGVIIQVWKGILSL